MAMKPSRQASHAWQISVTRRQGHNSRIGRCHGAIYVKRTVLNWRPCATRAQGMSTRTTGHQHLRLMLFEEAQGHSRSTPDCKQGGGDRDDSNKTSAERVGSEPGELAMMEFTDDLGVAFCMANEALKLTFGKLAKAWYRRGCAFAA
eukprot:1559548-Amphidinium_carterae.1